MRSSLKLLALAALASSSSTLLAANATWNGVSSTWTDNSNWSPAAFPGATSGTTNQDTATFLSSGNSSVTYSTINVKNIVFGDGTNAASAFSLSGTLVLTSGGGITTLANSGANQTISGAFTLNGATIATNDSVGKLTLSLSGTANNGLTKTGIGTLELAGAGSFNNTGGNQVFNFNEGTTILNRTNASSIGGSGATVNIGGSATAVVRYGSQGSTASGGGQIVNTQTVNINNQGTLDLNGFSATLNILNLTGGTISTGAGTLTLGTTTTLITSASASSSVINGNLVTLDSGNTISVADGAAASDLVINAAITGGDAINKTGAGRLVLAAANTVGAITVSGGSLESAAVGALGSSVSVGNNTMAFSGANQSYSSDVFGITDGVTFEVAANRTLTFSSGGTKNASATKSGAGTWELRTGFAGAGKTFQVSEGIALLNRSGTPALSSGSGVMNVNVGGGSGSAILRNASSNQISSNNIVTVAQNGTLDLNGFNNTLDDLRMTGGAVTTGAGTLTLGLNNALKYTGTTNQATMSGNLALVASQVNTIDVADGSQAVDLVIGSTVSGTGSGLTKSGNGTLRLTGSNSYGGATQVSAGTLLVDNTAGSATGAGAVTVAAGAQIGGNGTIGGSLTLDNNARFVFSLTDTLNLTGNLTLNNSFGVASLVNADGSSINWSGVSTGTYTLMTTSFVFNSSNISNFGVANAYDIGGGRSAYFSNGSLILNVVPEPSTWLLVAVASTICLTLRRRCRSC